MTTPKDETTTELIDPAEIREAARDAAWGRVKKALEGAAGAAWDECHKIYVLKDDEQLRVMREYDYPQIVERATESSAGDADAALLETIEDWFSRSCQLKFVQAVATVVDGDPNDEFETLIEQGHPAFGG